MNRRSLVCFLLFLMASFTCASRALADTTVGYISYTLSTPPNMAEFDVVNQTGPNASTFPDLTFPVTNTVHFSDLNLVVNFASGPSETFGSSYFTPNADGISFDGTPLSDNTGQPSGLLGATSAVLSGTFSTTTFNLSDGTTVTVDPDFSAMLTDASGLMDGDFGLITASAAGASGPVGPTGPTGPTGPIGVTPEPDTFLLMASGLVGLAGLRRRSLLSWARTLSGRSVGAGVLALAGLLLATSSVGAQVKLNTWTAPSTGLAGSTVAAVTGTGFPSGSIVPTSVSLKFSATCGGAALASEAPNSVTKIVGSSDRLQFTTPGTLAKGNYFISLTGTSAGGSSFSSTSCSEIAVTQTTTTLAACVPTSSLAVTVGSSVTAYVPFGYWDGGTTGIAQVPLEGSAASKLFTTTGLVNSCASNSVTTDVICTENNANVDVIRGSTLSTIVSGSNAYASFSGGACENCGVAINPSNNTAVIAMGFSGSGGGGSGIQVMNVGSSTFNAPVPLNHYVSEDISIDSGRNLILSPGEGGVYDLLKIGAGNTITEYGNYTGGELDSAAEDCTTGIALAADEFTDLIYITDLTQASFTAGSPGTWTAPGKFINLSDGGYSAGTCGLSSAPGTGHLAVVTGEFGGSAYSALKLPSSSGTGTPDLADYAYVAGMPNTPDGRTFSAGYDPHTITAYTSPNNGKSYAVVVDYATGTPNYLGVIDLACVLALPRSAGTHEVVGTGASCTRYVPIS